MLGPLLRGLRSVRNVLDPATVVEANTEAINDALCFMKPDSDVPGAPATGRHFLYEKYVDGNFAVWVCTAAGTPGAWVKVTSGASE